MCTYLNHVWYLFLHTHTHTSIGHGEKHVSVVLDLEVLVRKFGSINRLDPCPITVDEVPALDTHIRKRGRERDRARERASERAKDREEVGEGEQVGEGEGRQGGR